MNNSQKAEASIAEKRIYTYIKQKLKNCWPSLLFSVLVIIFRAIILLFPSVLTAYIIDKALAVHNIHLLWQYCIVFVLIPIVSGLSIFLDMWLCRIYLIIGSAFRVNVLEGILYQPYLKLKSFDIGRASYLVCNQINDLSSKAFSGIELFIWCLATVITGIIISLHYNVMLTVLMLICSLINVYCIKKIRTHIQKITQELNDINAQVRTFLRNSLDGAKQVKVSGAEAIFQIKYEALLKKRTKLNLKNSRLMLMPTMANSLSNALITVGYYFIGGLLIPAKQMTIGELSAMILVYNIIIAPITMLGDSYFSVISIKTVIREISKMYFQPQTYRKGIEIKEKKLTLSSSNVCFAYSKENVLDNLNIEMGDKDIIFIVGQSGSGKSTLCDILLKLFPPTSGSITVNNTNINDLDEKWYKNKITYVSQDDIIFSGTLSENIAYQDRNIDKHMIVQAMKEAEIYDWVQTLPEKEDTYLTNDGITLSGGERQRINIARALVTNPQIIIFDETLSAIDMSTSVSIINNIKKGNATRKLVFITHNLSLCQFADMIYVLKKGKIIEKGTHSQLIENRQEYYNLYSGQQIQNG